MSAALWGQHALAIGIVLLAVVWLFRRGLRGGQSGCSACSLRQAGFPRKATSVSLRTSRVPLQSPVLEDGNA